MQSPMWLDSLIGHISQCFAWDDRQQGVECAWHKERNSFMITIAPSTYEQRGRLVFSDFTVDVIRVAAVFDPPGPQVSWSSIPGSGDDGETSQLRLEGVFDGYQVIVEILNQPFNWDTDDD